MTFRGSQIYVKPETRKLLTLIAKARSLGETADELGDNMLMGSMIRDYPAVKDFLGRVEELEQQMMEEIRK